MSAPDARREATRVQSLAADPARSTALRASAGSGKTRTLVDRFVRLCVEGEHNDVHPRSILAITFTREAATDIRRKLLRRARGLALAAEEPRRATLTALFGGRPPLAAEEERAARLYERLLEDPAGLQVGTIHSFCQRILARFAVEAGLDPHAGLVEDRDEYVEEALDRLTVEIAGDPELAALALDLGGRPSAVRQRVAAVFAEQMRVERWLRRVDAKPDLAVRPRAPLAPALLAEVRRGLLGEPDPGDAVAVADPEPDLLAAASELAGPGLDAVRAALAEEELDKLAKPLAALRDKVAAAADATDLHRALLTGKGDLQVFSRVRDAALKARFQQLVVEAAAPVLRLFRRLDLVDLYRRNRATLVLGLRALDILDELKRRDRVLDFGDLEDMACVLMGEEARALSLLYRLEDSLRHVLVDEFQDTNFNQRDILAPFVAEFLGSGEEAGSPTVFFVGDLKQSIYGFRGAEPGIFAGVMAELTACGQEVHSLPTNFRSLPAVVDGVGGLFASEPLVSKLPPGEAGDIRQLVDRRGDAGPVTVSAAYEDEPDGLTAHQQAAVAAATIVRDLVDGGATTADGDAERPLRWSDVMVLYRSRTGVSLYEQALRDAGIPIEPAGRGMLAASREVQDVLALLRWLVWPEDDPALATVLRSPVVRLSETAFQRLLAARGLDRPRGLWSTLRRQAKGDARLAAITQRLEDWRADTGFVTCHELLRRVYREGHLPERYEAARGLQARINLERLFDLSLAPEVAGTPTVRRFVELVERAGRRGGQDEGTAAVGADGGRVHFMTIHGAKGLEAPVVLLVDADRALSERGGCVRLNAGHDATPLVFGALAQDRRGPAGTETVLAGDLLLDAGAAATAAAAIEETNLLYVALTRARDRLYVLGGRGRHKAGGEPGSFLGRLRAAAEGIDGASVTLDDPPGVTRPPAPLPGRIGAASAAGTKEWSPPTMGAGRTAVAPSARAHDEDGNRVLAARAVAHGQRVHLLLQLAAERGAMPPGSGAAHDEARAVFEDERLAWIFRPEAVDGRGLAEVPFTGRDPGAETVTGFIDRLVVRPDRVDVIDFKTDRWGGDPVRRTEIGARYAPQLAAYREAVAGVYPERRVRMWLLLTDPAGRSAEETGLVEVDR